MSTLKQNIKTLLPPLLLDFYKKVNTKYGYFGDYNNWQAAQKYTTSFEDNAILDKIKDSINKFLNGQAVFERDSIIYEEPQYSWQLLTTLLYIAAQKENINILDFGGSLGSTYFTHKKFLPKNISYNWSVVELEKFVVYGKKYFEDSQLKFYLNIDEAMNHNSFDIIALSGVICYLDKPYQFLEHLINKKFEYIFIDRTLFFESNDRITIQKVHPSIYNANNSCWVFNKKKMADFFEKDYEIIEFFKICTPAVNIYQPFDIAQEHGLILKRKN